MTAFELGAGKQAETGKYGTKISKILEEIKKVSLSASGLLFAAGVEGRMTETKIPQDESILIYVQFDDLMDILAKALDGINIITSLDIYCFSMCVSVRPIMVLVF